MPTRTQEAAKKEKTKAKRAEADKTTKEAKDAMGKAQSDVKVATRAAEMAAEAGAERITKTEEEQENAEEEIVQAREADADATAKFKVALADQQEVNATPVSKPLLPVSLPIPQGCSLPHCFISSCPLPGIPPGLTSSACLLGVCLSGRRTSSGRSSSPRSRPAPTPRPRRNG